MSEEEAGEPDPVEEPADDLVTTRHTLRTSESAGRGPGDELAYTATAGRIVLRREQHTEGAFDGHKPTAEVFVVAYTADRPDGGSAGWDPADRPLTVAFNGGPGSSSVWLHLGLLGPRRVLSGEASSPVAPPYRLTDNGETLLAHSDLLFIDPTEFEGRAVSVGDTLAAAMRANPHLRVHVCCGDYDGATPYQGAEHMIAGLTIPDELRANIEFRYYESGHMTSDKSAQTRPFTAGIAAPLVDSCQTGLVESESSVEVDCDNQASGETHTAVPDMQPRRDTPWQRGEPSCVVEHGREPRTSTTSVVGIPAVNGREDVNYVHEPTRRDQAAPPVPRPGPLRARRLTPRGGGFSRSWRGNRTRGTRPPTRPSRTATLCARPW